MGIETTGKRTWNLQSATTYNYGGSQGSDTLETSADLSISAFPVLIQGIYTVPLSKLRLQMAAGIGCYFGQVSYNTRTAYSWPQAPGQNGLNLEATTTFKAHPVTLGFQVGAGAEYPISNRLFLAVDLTYRLARFSTVKGNLDWEEKSSWAGKEASASGSDRDQTWWIGDSDWEGATYRRTSFASAQPDWLENGRAFRICLNGACIKVGIGIRL